MTRPLSLRVPGELMEALRRHLFPGDRDEHGAVIAASVLKTERGTRLLAHRLFLARDGIDYVPGKRGYRMLTATFVMDCALACAELGMAYLAVHCHGGGDRVGFSPDDLASHDRGYPALLDILNGPPVGALVFATDAVAGDIWFSGRSRLPLDELVVAGRPIRRMYEAPPPRPQHADERYDRQARLFGDRGQDLLGRQKIGVIGAGGAGSLIVEYLARLGVGRIVAVDPERIDPSNLSRVVGSKTRDTRPLLTHAGLPAWLRKTTELLRTSKVNIARRVAKQAHPSIRFAGRKADVTAADGTADLVDCDYLFLAADSMQARLVFNALVHQYLIPGVQVGAKVSVDPKSGQILDLFTVARPVVPGVGCLWCNGLILPARLQEEATSPEQRRRQRYVNEEDLPAPSVITLNAVACSTAADDFLMSVTGLLDDVPLEWTKTYPRFGTVVTEIPRRDHKCKECSSVGRLGRGPTMRLPVRLSS
jgi:tRNA A37 threonylcarbamoyladenosine dehydratase